MNAFILSLFLVVVLCCVCGSCEFDSVSGVCLSTFLLYLVFSYFIQPIYPLQSLNSYICTRVQTKFFSKYITV